MFCAVCGWQGSHRQDKHEICVFFILGAKPPEDKNVTLFVIPLHSLTSPREKMVALF